ncbi:hypothetical protein CPT_Percy21 [Caulobacter phage Percy]|uniref:Uncharacterized protein n=1 Tax=Caulobacter phage Percy TaxID=1701809 RepID=A0A0M4RSN0_9CAUD|nr:hypothetical protein CPT_Percy21 [Caulobacter phage Percy]ALF01655.1 hypothetical protein CPT_Percy21 [Caulobacter phage Percy]
MAQRHTLPQKVKAYEEAHIGDRFRDELRRRLHDPNYYLLRYLRCHVRAHGANLASRVGNPPMYLPPDFTEIEFQLHECPVCYWVVADGDIIDKWWKDQG